MCVCVCVKYIFQNIQIELTQSLYCYLDIYDFKTSQLALNNRLEDSFPRKIVSPAFLNRL